MFEILISRMNASHARIGNPDPALIVRGTKIKPVHHSLLWVSHLFILILSTSTFAIGSGEKTPEEKAIIAEKSAVDHYNSGVKAMAKARETALKGDSTFAFNYRATSDAKVKKHFEKAVREFEQAAKLDPKMKEALNNLGYCYRKLGMLTESLAAYDKAIGIDPNFAQAREYRGETYLALAQLDKAKAELTFLIDAKSPYADSLTRAIQLYELAQINEKMGK